MSRPGSARYFTQYETGAFIQDQWTISPNVEPQPRPATRLLRHRIGSARTGCRRLCSGRGPRSTSSWRAHPSATSISCTTREAELLAAGRPGVGPARERTDLDSQRLQHGVSAASRAVDLGRPRASAGCAAGRHPALEQDRHARSCMTFPVPYNPEFARGLNEQGGVQSRPGEPAIRITGFVVNPTIKTQYTETWFVNGQRRLGQHWMRRARVCRHARRQPRTDR